MIRFTEIKAANIGRHRTIAKKITGNVLGLSGPSGVGKSTVLQLLEWMLTGKIEHPDPIAEFVRKSEVDDVKKMTGFARMEVDGKPMEIERSQPVAGSGSRKVRWDLVGQDWKQEQTSAAGAESLLTSLIGTNQKAISSIVFIRQGAFGKLFSGLDTERREFFVRLLMLGHLEKIAAMVDTQRKQLMGSVQDLSAVRDTAEAAYNAARTYFEEQEFELARTKAYTKEIDAGVSLSGLLDRVMQAEITMRQREVSLQGGLVANSTTNAGYPTWLETTEGKLNELRASLQTVVGQRKNLTHYTKAKTDAEAWLYEARTWRDLKSRYDELTRQIDEVKEAAGKPDPRLRIADLDRWTQAYTERAAALEEQPAAVDTLAALSDEEITAANLYNDAYDAGMKVKGRWDKAVADLEDAQELKAAVDHASDGQQCKACGNTHPDPKFLETAITNTKSLVGALHAEWQTAEAKWKGLFTSLNDVTNRKVVAKTKVTHTEETIKTAETKLGGAPNLDDIAPEKAALEAEIPAYDASKSMHTHLVTQRGAIQLGEASYSAGEIRDKEAELNLTVQMLMPFPPVAELEAREHQLTEEGVSLKNKRDQLVRLADNYQAAVTEHTRHYEAMKEMFNALPATVPLLVSKLTALGPVTETTVGEILVELRARQTEYDTQTGATAAANEALKSADRTLIDVDLAIAEQKNRITLAKELEVVRAAFLPTGITTEYLEHQFSRIAVTTQDHLAQMSADFMVVASENRALSFDFLRLNEPGGAWLSQNRMSGGQQVKLAIAVLLAIHELIIPDVGLLVLDEPSTHLDQDSRIALAEVLKDIGLRGNFQLVVCDHSPELKDAYTDVIELSADPS